MKSALAKSSSTKQRQRRALALIAGVCALLIIGLTNMADILTHGNEGGFGARFVTRHPGLMVFDQAEESATNFLHNHGWRAPLDSHISFLALDTASFEQSNLFENERQDPALEMLRNGMPLPRTFYPLVIKKLVDAGARVVMFDILFPGPKPEDDAFREALDKYRDHVVIGSNLQIGLTEKGGASGVITAPSASLIPGEDRLFDSRVGFVNFKPDGQIVRRAQYRANILEYFGEKPEALGENPESAERELLSLTAQGARKAGYEDHIPPGRPRLPFRFVDLNNKVYSISDLFVPTKWEKNFRNGEYFRDKLVFIGPYGNWSKDELQTPFGLTLGPVIHISALNALLRKQFLRYTSRDVDALLVLLAGAVAVALGWSIADPVWRTTVLVGALVLYVALALASFNFFSLILPLVSPTATLLSGGFIGLVWERVIEANEKKRVRSTLERYVSKDVVKEVLDNPASFLNTAGGMRKPITLLFSDIRGFTAMTESADAEKVVEQLNEYFTEMVRIVFAHRGTLDKFIGDAVMAHWGGIVSRGEGPDACRAVAAALDMLQLLPKLNAGWKARGLPELKIGLGVNHGHVICANIGSYEKQEFTAIGDAVNFAARLEGATKKFHQDLLIGETAAALVADHYVLRPVDFIQVLGKTKPVEIFAVLGDRSEMPEPAWLPAYVEGIRLYRRRSFDEAHAKFTQVLEVNAGDWLSLEYARRCAEYRSAAPAASWDGSYEMLTK